MKGLLWKRFAKLGVLLMSLFAIAVISLANTNSTYAAGADSTITYYGSSGWFAKSGSYQSGTWNINKDDNTSSTVGRFTPFLNYADGGTIYVSKVQVWFNWPSGISVVGKTGFSTEWHVIITNNYSSSSSWLGYYCGASDNWTTTINSTNNVSLNVNVVSKGCTKTDNPNFIRLKMKVVVTPAGGGTFNTNPNFNIRWDGNKNSNIFLISSGEATAAADYLKFYGDVNFVNFETFTSADAGYLQDISQNIQQTNDILQQQQQQDQQDRQDLQDSQSDANSSADDSSQQAEATGSTLLQAFTNFVGALTSANPSDCNIDFNIMGYINGGRVNLCQLNIPPALQTISSIILIGFCVPLSIATAKKIIVLFRSFQS